MLIAICIKKSKTDPKAICLSVTLALRRLRGKNEASLKLDPQEGWVGGNGVGASLALPPSKPWNPSFYQIQTLQ